MAYQNYINISRRDWSLLRLRKNRKRELYYSLLVDFFVVSKKTNRGEKVRMSTLVDNLLVCTHTPKTRNNREFCNTAIAEFGWMGMVGYEDIDDGSDVYVYALPPLFDAFRSRTFHSNYANLEEARESRLLSLVALVIALASLGFTLMNR